MESSLRGHAAYQQEQQQQHNQSRHPNQHPYHSNRGVSGGGAGGVSGLSASLGDAGGLGASLSAHQQQQQPQHQQDYMSVGSHYSRGSHASSQTSSVVDEAYRRLGARLSRRAHGNGPMHRPQRLGQLGLAYGSTFVRYSRTPHGGGIEGGIGATLKDGTTRPSGGLAINRTTKVAKTRYNDHGDHHENNNNSNKLNSQSKGSNILKKMTMEATDRFRLWQTEAAAAAAKGRKKRTSPTLPTQQQQQQQQTANSNKASTNTVQGGGGNSQIDLSPQRFAFSQLALETGGGNQPLHHQHQQGSQKQNHRHHHHLPDQLEDHLYHNNKKSSNHGLLSAVMEQMSQASSKSKTGTDSPSVKSKSSLSSSIATRSSIGTKSSVCSFRSLPRGKCLTQPSTPVANDGLDNAEGNLIVYENDLITVSRPQVHMLLKDKIRKSSQMEFRIQGLLGQGTFAQVFQCQLKQTGEIVAVKIVKNKPAYTRQAAVEIDVFRALSNEDENGASSSASSTQLPNQQQQHNSRNQPLNSPVGSSGEGGGTGNNNGRQGGGGGSKWDYMVNLVCYFMHRSHLCLVFELLGLNLYEVLKRRQFRGLPLPVVRSLVRQAVGGIKELSHKSIVHCDLKPENILLVTDDDVDSVVSAGENRKSRSRPSSLERKDSATPPTSTGLKLLQNSTDRSVASTAPVESVSQSPSNSIGRLSVTTQTEATSKKIKLIDFGSACFEGQTSHTYIQSRFYRSPEVLVGLPYDSAIDMWSLGCVAAELFLGLPILPGVHEHDQLGRICEMIAKLPDWMLDQGSKSSKYFVKFVPRSLDGGTPHPPTPPPNGIGATSPRPLPQWRIRTQQEYIASLSQSEVRKKGGLAKLEKQPANRYFKRKKLSDIIMHKGQSGNPEDKDMLELFVHFLYGILDPDPWKRWTAHQASSHPFVTGGAFERRDNDLNPDDAKNENHANTVCDIYWEPPWDPGICRRKLLNVQKMRDKQQAMRRGFSNNRSHGIASGRAGQSLDGVAGDNTAPSRGVPSLHVPESPSRGVAGRSQQSQSFDNRNVTSNEQVRMSQGLAGQMEQAGAYQMSSSLSDYAVQATTGGRLAGDSSLSGQISSSQVYPAGPQSFSDLSFNGPHGSLNPPDFAYALQRPGVVPMGESVSSSVDLNPTMQVHHHHQQASGIYGSSQGQQMRQHQRRGSGSAGMTSRSFGEHSDSRISTDPRHLVHSSLQQAGSFSGQLGSYGNRFDINAQPQSNILPPTQDPPHQGNSFPLQTGASASANDVQQQQFAAQAYLQQQHAAIQQQQALLQQQQVALALQQQQLQAYGMNNTAGISTNPVGGLVSGTGQPNGMNQYGTTGAGYYYVSSADGTPMLLPSGIHQGANQHGLQSTYGMAPHHSNMATYQDGYDESGNK